MPGDRVAVAVSGGADSVALAWLLHDLAAAGEIDGAAVAGLVHVNHGLRGAESDRDEAFVRALGARLGLPVDVVRVDVASLARVARRSVESVAREARDRSFVAAAARLGATVVATAHTADDQAETVLLRLLRGAGARGAGGIRPRRGLLIRPLLDTRRAALRAELLGRGEAWCEDSSNADRAIPRNAVRHDLLPVIDRLAPGGISALVRFAALARDDEAELQIRAIEVARKIVLLDPGGVDPAPAGHFLSLARAPLAALSPAVARRVVRHALEQVNAASVSARSIEVIRRLAAADTSRRHIDVAGVAIDVSDADLRIAPGLGRSKRAAAGSYDQPLTVPGSVDVVAAGVRVTAERADGIPFDRWPNGRGPIAAVQGSSIRGALRVRGRRPGDRLRPLGAPGRRKVQDVLVDRKVPRADRDRVPIVVDETGQIVWVAGHALADHCRVTAPECGVVLLKIIDL